MKRKLIVAALLVVAMAFCGTAFAQDFPENPRQEFRGPDDQNNDQGRPGPSFGRPDNGEGRVEEGRRPRPPKSPLHLLMKYRSDNILAGVLSGLTGQALESIQEELANGHPGELIQAYGIDRETLGDAMDAKTSELTQAALASGEITREQADDILDAIANRPEPPVEDGGRDEEGRRPRPPKSPLHLLMKYRSDNILAGVLSGLTGQALESIQEELANGHPGEIIEAYGIDRETLGDAMDAKTSELTRAALASGEITQEQADDILDTIANRPEPPVENE